MEGKYNIVYYGNDTLKSTANEVTDINDEIVKLLDNMLNMMYKSSGIGLAAPQIDLPSKLIVFDFGDYKGKIKKLINPVVLESSKKESTYEEGCLSVPGISAEIVRPAEVLVSGITPEGKEVEIEAAGLLATVLQHEIDHLNGLLFIDHLEDYIRNELRSELKKIKKMNR